MLPNVCACAWVWVFCRLRGYNLVGVSAADAMMGVFLLMREPAKDVAMDIATSPHTTEVMVTTLEVCVGWLAYCVFVNDNGAGSGRCAGYRMPCVLMCACRCARVGACALRACVCVCVCVRAWACVCVMRACA